MVLINNDGGKMIYLEIIRVQLAEVDSTPLKTNIWALVQNELDNLDHARGQIFFKIDPPGEAMVMLCWDLEGFDPRGSRVARVLAKELQKYGLVNYSAWSERRSS